MARLMQNACTDSQIQKVCRPTTNQSNKVKRNRVQHAEMSV